MFNASYTDTHTNKNALPHAHTHRLHVNAKARTYARTHARTFIVEPAHKLTYQIIKCGVLAQTLPVFLISNLTYKQTNMISKQTHYSHHSQKGYIIRSAKLHSSDRYNDIL